MNAVRVGTPTALSTRIDFSISPGRPRGARAPARGPAAGAGWLVEGGVCCWGWPNVSELLLLLSYLRGRAAGSGHSVHLGARMRKEVLVAVVCTELCARCSAQSEPGASGSAMLSIQLSTTANDVVHDFGLIQNKVNPFEKDAVYQAPPSADWTTGAMNLGMYRSLQTPGEYVAYVGNTTGNIPLGGDSQGGTDSSNWEDAQRMCLRRWVTTDFVTWSGGQCVHMFDQTGMGAIKTMARDDRTGKLFALVYASKNASIYTSADDGKTFTGPTYPQGLLWRGPDSAAHMMYAKDDLNFVWTPEYGLTDFAIFWEKPVCQCQLMSCENCLSPHFHFIVATI